MEVGEPMAERTCVPWDDVISRLDGIVAQAPEPFDQDTIDNGRELIHYLGERFAPPDAFDKGYWSTFSLVWDNFEIEVFGDRFETYRFLRVRPTFCISRIGRASPSLPNSSPSFECRPFGIRRRHHEKGRPGAPGRPLLQALGVFWRFLERWIRRRPEPVPARAWPRGGGG